MSAMSEACPLCGTPTINNPDEVPSSKELISIKEESPRVTEMSQDNNTTLIKPCELNTLTDSRQTLAEALSLAAGHKKSYPLEVVYIVPVEDDGYDCISIGEVGKISNRPWLSSLGSEGYLMTQSDLTKTVAEINRYYGQNGYTNFDKGYNFTTLAALDIQFGETSQSVEVELSLNVGCGELASKVEVFNRLAPSEYGRLVLDVEAKTLTGEIKTIPVRGGMFEKRKLRKANETRFQALHELILAAYPYLEDRNN